MNDQQRSSILNSSSKFPIHQGVKVSYGTAGFRADASILPSTVFRVGILAALRSLKTKSVIGLMITASHNQVSDNGIKIADPSGGMMTQEWEPFADKIANAGSCQELVELICEFAKEENIYFEGNTHAEVFLARDTRPSGESLLEAAKQGINSVVGAIAVNLGILTTPQLHWMVRQRNKGEVVSEMDYFVQLSKSFRCLMDLIPKDISSSERVERLIVDGSNGVGGEKFLELTKMLNGLMIEVRNLGKKGQGVLNEGVGADFVQKEKIIPHGFDSNDFGLRCASLDGDADRLVYFRMISETNENIDLIDGDKILSLFSIFVKEQLDILQKGNIEIVKDHAVRIGVVQTAYANGASSDYLRNLGLEVVFTNTGVKHLHEKAAEYDIGIYFEANGHGTILFAEHFQQCLLAKNAELGSSSEGTDQHKATSRLLAVSKLINQAVGDGLSGLLLVELILRHLGWSILRWSELYKDLPSRMLKVKVTDRNAVTTSNAETMVAKPSGLQAAINSETEKYLHGRSFIRPSGTEDVIRVYAEASTQEEADKLAKSVAQHVTHFLAS